MTKNEAAEIFGNKTKLAAAVGVTKSAISQWPDMLTQEQEDRVIGAMVRLGIQLPLRKGLAAGERCFQKQPDENAA